MLVEYFRKRIIIQRIVIISFIFIMLSIFCLLFVLIEPSIMLKGNKTIYVEVNDEYKEPGVEVYYLFKKINDIKIDGNVDTKKIGEYKLKYTVSYNNKKYIKNRIVKVVDKTPPTFIFENTENVCSINDYYSKIKAIDNYDGDLTDKIDIQIKEDKITYIVKDSNGNINKKELKIELKDDIKPIITLNGDKYMQVYQGTDYNESGAIAIDNCLGDISNRIKTSGNVNTNEIGEYKVFYEVEDDLKNKTIETRIINVIPKQEKTVYLTFDDGPSMTITPKLLDILKEENVKATFFVINHSDNLNYLIKRAYDEGHTVALHSNSHSYKEIYSSKDAYFNDLNLIKNKVKNITGVESKIIRFPGGSSNTISNYNPGIMTILTNEVQNNGYLYFDWNVDSGDAGGARNSGDVYLNVVNNLNSDTNIVLLHDFESNYKTLDAIRDIITTIKNRGYKFDKITEETPLIKHSVNN